MSNISGDPFAKDGDGFVSRVSPAGRVVAGRVVAELRAEPRFRGAGLGQPNGLTFG